LNRENLKRKYENKEAKDLKRRFNQIEPEKEFTLSCPKQRLFGERNHKLKFLWMELANAEIEWIRS